jgi:hypothetical protein
MKHKFSKLLVLLVLCTACTPVPSSDTANATVSLEQAIDHGFPIYLPSADVLDALGIADTPIMAFKTQDRTCDILSVSFLYADAARDQTVEDPFTIIVSDGCAMRMWQGYPTELSWAVDGEAMRLGDDFVDELPPVILFHEPTRRFRYITYSQLSLDDTMLILESMELQVKN